MDPNESPANIPPTALPSYARELFQPHRYKVIYGGRGAGRSWSIARALLRMAASRPLRILCAREFQTSLADSVHRLLQDQIEALRIPGYEILKREIAHACGSLFLFHGIRNNVTKVKSLEGIDIAWVEEAEKVSAESWQVLIPTIRKAGSEIWVSFNPDEDTDPTYSNFVTNTPPDTYLKKCTYRSNPWFPDVLRREMEWLRKVDADAAAHVWDGECRSRNNAQVLAGKYRIEPFVPQADWDGPYLGADWGFGDDPTALVRCWISDGVLYIEKEAWGLRWELDSIADRFRPIAGAHLIRGDNSRPETISYLRRKGKLNIVSADKWPGSVEDGVEFLRTFAAIVIHPDCVHTAMEARHWSYKTDRLTGDVLPELVDRHNHTWDAVRYALAKHIRAGRELIMESL